MKKRYLLLIMTSKLFIFVILPMLLIGSVIASLIILLLQATDFSVAFKIEKSASFFGIPHKLNEYIKWDQKWVYTPLSDWLTYFNNNEVLSSLKFNWEFLNNVTIDTSKNEIKIYTDKIDSSSILNSNDWWDIINTNNWCVVRKDYNNLEFKKYFQEYYTKSIYEFKEEKWLKIKSLYFVFDWENKNWLCYRKLWSEYIPVKVWVKLDELDKNNLSLSDITSNEVEFRFIKEINQDILKWIVVPLNNKTFVSNFIEDLWCNPNKSCKSIYQPTMSENINDLVEWNTDKILLNDYRSIYIRFKKQITGNFHTEDLFKNDPFFIQKTSQDSCKIILEKKNQFENKTKNNYEQFIISFDWNNNPGGICSPKEWNNDIMNIKYMTSKMNTFDINNTDRKTYKDIDKRNLICWINNYENITGLKSLSDIQIKVLQEEIWLTQNEIDGDKIVCSDLYDDFVRFFWFKNKEDVTKDNVNVLDRSAIATYLSTTNKLTDFYWWNSKEIIFNDMNIQQAYKIVSEYMMYYIRYDYDGYGDRFFLHPNSVLFSISKSDKTTLENFFTKKDFKSTNFIKYYIWYVWREVLDKIVRNIEDNDTYEKNKMLLWVLLNYLSIISEWTNSDYYLFNTFRDTWEYAQKSEEYFSKNSNKNINFEITPDNKDYFKLLLSKTIWEQRAYDWAVENAKDLITFNSKNKIAQTIDKKAIVDLYLKDLDNPGIIKKHSNETLRIVKLAQQNDFIMSNIFNKKWFNWFSSSEIEEIKKLLWDISYWLSFEVFKNNYNPDDLYNAYKYEELKKNIMYFYIRWKMKYEIDTSFFEDNVQDWLIFMVRKWIENFPVYTSQKDLWEFWEWMKKIFNYSHSIWKYESLDEIKEKYHWEYISRDTLTIKNPVFWEINLKKWEYEGWVIWNLMFPPLITINFIKNQRLKSALWKDAWLDVYYNMNIFLLWLEAVNKEFLNYENIDLDRNVYDIKKMNWLWVFSKFYFNDRYSWVKILNEEYTQKQLYTEVKDISFWWYKKNQINKKIEWNKQIYCNSITDYSKQAVCYKYMDYLKSLSLSEYNQEMEWLESYFIFRDAKNNNWWYWWRNIWSPRRDNTAIIWECTHYVMLRKSLPGSWWNWWQYIDSARKKWFTVIEPWDLSSVRPGYLVSFWWWIYWHIAIVEEVDLENNRFKISEQNWKWPFIVSERRVAGNHKSINGFIVAEDKY